MDYDVLLARIEDEVYSKYNVEVEDIAAYYKLQGNENLNETQINNLKNSTSALLKLNRSLV